VKLKDICSLPLELNISSKKSLIGLNPKRADVINFGVIILFALMKKLGIKNIKRQENVPHFYKWRIPLWFSGCENFFRLFETPLM
jgi:hypothetical protein